MQTSQFPTSGAYVTQTAGINRNGTAISTYSHGGNRAIDICPNDGNFYAPFNMTCVYSQREAGYNGTKTPIMSVFISDQIVDTPTGASKVTLCCMHGGAVEKKTFQQGDKFYTQGGDFGLDKNGNQITYVDSIHIHLDARKGSAFTTMNLTSEGNYYLAGDLPVEDLFYNNGTRLTWNDTASWCIPFSLASSGEWNGWIADGGSWYYYVEGVKKTGWLEDPANSAKWFYLDSKKAGAMATGWGKVSGVDYYMNPAEGKSGHDANLAGGQMTRSKWVAGGSKWYYIKESGAMAKSESVLIHGKTYNFDSNGVCLNP